MVGSYVSLALQFFISQVVAVCHHTLSASSWRNGSACLHIEHLAVWFTVCCWPRSQVADLARHISPDQSHSHNHNKRFVIAPLRVLDGGAEQNKIIQNTIKIM